MCGPRSLAGILAGAGALAGAALKRRPHPAAGAGGAACRAASRRRRQGQQAGSALQSKSLAPHAPRVCCLGRIQCRGGHPARFLYSSQLNSRPCHPTCLLHHLGQLEALLEAGPHQRHLGGHASRCRRAQGGREAGAVGWLCMQLSSMPTAWLRRRPSTDASAVPACPHSPGAMCTACIVDGIMTAASRAVFRRRMHHQTRATRMRVPTAPPTAPPANIQQDSSSGRQRGASLLPYPCGQCPQSFLRMLRSH